MKIVERRGHTIEVEDFTIGDTLSHLNNVCVYDICGWSYDRRRVIERSYGWNYAVASSAGYEWCGRHPIRR